MAGHDISKLSKNWKIIFDIALGSNSIRAHRGCESRLQDESWLTQALEFCSHLTVHCTVAEEKVNI